MPFSQAIMNTVIPTNFMTPKITFTGTEDLDAHITAFHTQMMISGETDAIHYKLFMGTFSGTTLDWFISLPDGLVHQPPRWTSSSLRWTSSQPCSESISLLTRLPLPTLSISSTRNNTRESP